MRQIVTFDQGKIMGAKKSNETIYRQWEILKLLPTRGRGISVQEIIERLASAGLEADESGTRTIQRDLERLSALFPLDTTSEGKKLLWKKRLDHGLFPDELSLQDALSLYLMKDFLKKSLPHQMSKTLGERIESAVQKISALAGIKTSVWHRKFRLIHNALHLEPPTIRPAILKKIQDALLGQQQIKIAYEPPQKKRFSLVLHPHYLICKGEIFYLVGQGVEVREPFLYALHRIRDVQVLEAVAHAPKENIDEYLQSRRMDFFGENKTIQLVARLHATEDFCIATILGETKLSPDQKISLDGTRLTATVTHSWELKRWLLARTHQIEVLKPAFLREEMTAHLMQSIAHYQTSTPSLKTKKRSSRKP